MMILQKRNSAGSIAFKALLLSIVGIGIYLVPMNNQFTYGYDTSPASAPDCRNARPKAIVLYEPNHALLPKATGTGQVRLNWLKAENIDKYTLAYGLSSGNYIYGLPDIGNTDNFTVQHLVPGVKYYFAVRGNNGCMPGEWSREWAVTVGGSRVYSNTNTGSSSQRNNTLSNNPVYRSTTITPSVTQQRVQTTTQQQAYPTVVNTNTTNNSYVPPLVTPAPAPQGFFQRLLSIFGFGR